MSRVGYRWFCIFFVLLYCVHRRRRSQSNTTGDHAAIRGLAPTFLASVGCLPHARDARTLRPPHAAEGGPTPGRRRCRGPCEPWRALAANPPLALGLRCHRPGRGHSPPTGTQGSGHGDHDLRGIVALGPEGARPCAEPPLGLPAEGLERGGELCQTPVPVPTDLGRLPLGPGPCAQGPPGRGLARRG